MFFAYPDVVVCDQPELADHHQDTLLNPKILIEVVSPSTESYDRHERALRYRRIVSLREYVLIAQDECWIEHVVRRSTTKWWLEDVLDLNRALRFDSIDLRDAGLGDL